MLAKKERKKTHEPSGSEVYLWNYGKLLPSERAGDNHKFNFYHCITEEEGACSCGTVLYADCTVIEEEIPREQDGRNVTGWLAGWGDAQMD